MHATSGPKGTTFHHHGDFSGLVLFTASEADGGAKVEASASFQALAHALRSGPREFADAELTIAATPDTSSPSDANAARVQVVVPAADVAALVAERIRGDLISWAEEADVRELLTRGGEQLHLWASEEPDWR